MGRIHRNDEIKGLAGGAEFAALVADVADGQIGFVLGPLLVDVGEAVTPGGRRPVHGMEMLVIHSPEIREKRRPALGWSGLDLPA
jgi:hypothetical protein